MNGCEGAGTSASTSACTVTVDWSESAAKMAYPAVLDPEWQEVNDSIDLMDVVWKEITYSATRDNPLLTSPIELEMVETDDGPIAPEVRSTSGVGYIVHHGDFHFRTTGGEGPDSNGRSLCAGQR